MAIEDAKEKADSLSSELGVRLIKVSGFAEDSSFNFPMLREAGLGGGGSPDIQLGENEIFVKVTLIYEID